MYLANEIEKKLQDIKNTIPNIDAGGGGGDSDFSTAEVTFTVVNTYGDAAVGIAILNNDMFGYVQGIAVENNETYSYVLYKGSQVVEAYDTAEITVEGNAEIIDQREEDGTYIADIQITGDCIIHLTGSSDT